MYLHEIELYGENLSACQQFYNQTLGLSLRHATEDLRVFDGNGAGLDFNVSRHQSGLKLSFLTNSLEGVIQTLTEQNVAFRGPFENHLGLTALELHDPAGNLIVINAPTETSPAWLRARVA